MIPNDICACRDLTWASGHWRVVDHSVKPPVELHGIHAASVTDAVLMRGGIGIQIQCPFCACFATLQRRKSVMILQSARLVVVDLDIGEDVVDSITDKEKEPTHDDKTRTPSGVPV